MLLKLLSPWVHDFKVVVQVNIFRHVVVNQVHIISKKLYVSILFIVRDYRINGILDVMKATDYPLIFFINGKVGNAVDGTFRLYPLEMLLMVSDFLAPDRSACF